MRERFYLEKYRSTRDKPRECDACGAIFASVHAWEDGFKDRRGVSHNFVVYLCSECNDKARMGQLPLNIAVDKAVIAEYERMFKE